MINKIVIIFVLFTVSFIQPNDKPKIKDGAIFGKVAFLETGNIKPFKITLMETNKVVKHDSEGYFYINNLKPGLYNLKIQIEGSNGHYAEKINVLSSKISCLGTLYIERSFSDGKIEWGIVEYQNKIEPIRYGKIEGYIVDTDGKPVSDARLRYKGFFWEGMSDSSGYFRINKVIPGHYKEISALSRGGDWAYPFDIDVKSNSVLKIKLEIFPNPQIFHLN